MNDIVVVGAGVAGSVLTRMARARGLSVCLVDQQPQDAASWAALATLRDSWHPDTAEAVAWYRSNAMARMPRTLVSRWNAEPKVQPGWWLVDPAMVLVEPDVIGSVIGAERGGIQLYDGPYIAAELVVVSHPAWTSDHPQSWGATAYSETAWVQDGSMRVHWLRPFHAIFAAWTPETGTRVGSSVEPTAERALERARRMVSEATDNGLVTVAQDWTYRVGPRWAASAPEAEAGIVRLGGLARLGFTLAPSLARAILDDHFGAR